MDPPGIVERPTIVPSHGEPGPLKKKRKGATRLSCAECRRLKLRCDRQVPCGSCKKRGTSAICPDGCLTTGQGNRFVLASTQELHEKISELSHRVRELEDALRADHAQLTRDPHPLLSQELLKIKMPLQREIPALRNGVATTAQETSTTEVFDAFGSLSIDVSGKSKFYGHAANSWYFLQNETVEDELEDPIARLTQAQLLSPEILARASSISTSSSPYLVRGPLTLHDLMWYLPPGEKAVELKGIFYRQAAWMYNCITEEAFDTEVFRRFYDMNWQTPEPMDGSTAHLLSILFMVIAIGCLMDTNQPAYNIEAEKFHQLAKASLSFSCFIEDPTLYAVQALYLMTFYMFLSDRHGARTNARWTIMGIAIKIAQSIGLHKDSARWKLADPGEVQRRREAFWELMTYDTLQCMTFSRPPSFSLAHIDTRMPYIDDNSDEHSYANWKHRFTVECMTPLHDQAFSAKTPSHSTVIQLDRKLRTFPVPAILQATGTGAVEGQTAALREPVGLILQRHIVLSLRETNLLYLHRSFFARAITDHPSDPLGSPYGASVIAAYRSAAALITLLRSLHSQLKDLSERMWFLWSHIFSCSIILGSIVTRCPSLSFASSALAQLDSACELFQQAAQSFRARKVLMIMQHLKQKAHRSLEDFNQSKLSSMDRRHDRDTPPAETEELSALGGQTRLVTKNEAQSPTLMERSPNSLNPIVPLPLSPAATQQAHLAEYLNSFLPPDQQQMQMQQARGQSAYPSPDELSPVSVQNYNMAVQPEANYMSIQQQTNAPMPQSFSQPAIMRNSSGNNMRQQAFPNYFPVYDYSPSGMNVNGQPPYNGVPVLDMNPTPSHQRASASPDMAWQDFVNSI